MSSKLSLFTFLLFFSFVASAQDTLPQFSLVNKGNNRIVASWTNPYGKSIRQLSVQRSFDSLKTFKTIVTLPDPTVLQNGYVDQTSTSDQMFYRLYILLDSGKYVFSKSKKPTADVARVTANQPPVVEAIVKDTSATKINPPATTSPVIEKPRKETPNAKPKEVIEKFIFVKKRDTLIGQVNEKNIRRFRDSIAYRTKDTLFSLTADTIVIKPFVPKEVYKPSKFVFTERDGNVRILLPDVATKKYNVKFFEDDTNMIFEIKQIKDRSLLVDKSNFIHSGWFKFELYEDGELKEKHRLFVPKDF